MNPIRLANPQWRSVVIDRYHVVVCGADDRGGIRVRPLPTGMISDPGWLLDTVAATAFGPEITVVTDRVPLYEFGDDPRPFAEQLREIAHRAKTHGWETSEASVELGTGWTTWTKTGARDTAVVHLGIRPMMENGACALFGPEDDAETIARRLMEYGSLTGAAFRATPGVSGLAALRNFYDVPIRQRRPGLPLTYTPRPEPKFVWYGAPERLIGAGDVKWKRQPTAEERKMRNVFMFDTRAAYLAAASGARLGWHAPKNTGAIMWDPGQSGFYRIRVPREEWADGRRGVPIINPARVHSDRTAWVTAPILAYISERGYALPEIIDSWTCAGSAGRDVRNDITGPYLGGWADRLRDALPDARTAGDPVLRAVIKRTYAEAIGLMGRAGGRVYRLDWHATIIDEARVRLLRKVHHHYTMTKTWPLEVRTDAVFYATNLDVTGADDFEMPTGTSIGRMRLQSTQTMAEYLSTPARRTPRQSSKASA